MVSFMLRVYAQTCEEQCDKWPAHSSLSHMATSFSTVAQLRAVLLVFNALSIHALRLDALPCTAKLVQCAQRCFHLFPTLFSGASVAKRDAHEAGFDACAANDSASDDVARNIHELGQRVHHNACTLLQRADAHGRDGSAHAFQVS